MKLRVYDNGGETMDRYTVIPTPRLKVWYRGEPMVECLGLSLEPLVAGAIACW